MEFTKLLLKEEIEISKIISLHYFEFVKDYSFQGEKHDFWEFLYVDKGEAEVIADLAEYNLKQGDIIFHKPNEFHSVRANKKIAPNLVVIAFECKSEAMKYFERKIFKFSDSERNILATIVNEGINAFLPPLDMPGVNTIKRNPSSPFGCEQLFKIHLEHLLISLIRKGDGRENIKRLSSSARQRSEVELFKRIKSYMEKNIYLNLTLDQLCSYFNISKTHLKTLIKAKTGMAVMEYFSNLKIEQAKILIREKQQNLTEIAEILGYSSIHSFSRRFKTIMGMSPSEYTKTVKARLT